MYKCEFCKSQIQRNIKSNRVTVLIRKKVYPYRKDAVWGPDKNTGKYKWLDDPGGSGYEIATEKIACPDCEKKIPTLRRDA